MIIALGISLIIGYLIGSIMVAMIISNSKRINIRSFGSGNVGSTNIMRRLGWKWGIVCLTGDALKAAVSVFLGGLIGKLYTIFETGAMNESAIIRFCGYCALLGAILGHLLPLYHGFRGGKCVSTALGGMLAIAPVQLLIALAAAIVLIAATGMMSVGSVCGTILAGALIIYKNWGDIPLTVLIVIIIAVIVVAHLPNIQRILAGNERKITKIAWEENACSSSEQK